MSCGRSFQESQVHVVWKIIPRVTGTCRVEDHSKSHRYMSCGRSFQESQVHVVWKIIPRVTGTCRVEDHSKSHRYMSCGRSFQESQVHVVWKIIPRVTGTCRVEDHSTDEEQRYTLTYLVGIATKLLDVSLDPLEGRHLVHETVVAR